MKTLYTTICRPGGMIINPRDGISDQTPTICDPGNLIYMVADKLIIMTAYAEMHQAHTSRPIDSQLMTRAFIKSLAPLLEQELSYSDPQAIDNPLNDTSMSKWLESLDDYLSKFRGVNKFPLAYVARAQVAVKPHAAYPATEYKMLINR